MRLETPPAKLITRVFDRRADYLALADTEELCAEKLDHTAVDPEGEDAVADNLWQIGYGLVLAAILCSCTGTDIENAALGAAKSWSRLHSPQYCSVNDDRPSL